MSCNGLQLCIYVVVYSSLLARDGAPLNLKGLPGLQQLLYFP